jgi:uncharacterized SAM-binding protein YcdF (DUF218 family)
MSHYIQPFFAFLVIATLAGVAAWGKKPRPWFVLVCAVGLFVFTLRPAARAGVWFLEAGYSTQPPGDHAVQAIVVLSSSVLPPEAPRETAIPGSDTYERCAYAAWLYQHWTAVPVLASGGGRLKTPYSLAMREVMEHQGVPPDMIWTEETSRNTYENALYSARILRQKGIRKVALVTEAYHMSRAEQSFRKQGIEVVPAPCGFRKFHGTLDEYIPDWQAVSWNEDTLHEAFGLLWYRIRGRI